MAWKVPETEGTGRGLFQEIPEGGYAGWTCFYNGEDAKERYTCRSVHVPEDTNFGFNAPDLREE